MYSGWNFFEIQDDIASSLPEHTSLLKFKLMTPKQRRSFFQCISTSTLADYFMTTPPKVIADDVDFQDFRELINTVIPFSSYFLQQRNNSVSAEGDFNNVYSKGYCVMQFKISSGIRWGLMADR